MKEIKDLKTIQNMELNILKEFALFCDNNSLRYSLMGGTLLGAVRHNGFIPWDDDIDVSMPRPDYEKFLELTSEGMSSTFKVISLKYSNYINWFTKVIDTRTIMFESPVMKKYAVGLYIDVFPVDGYPGSDRENKKYLKTLKKNRASICEAKRTFKQKDILRTIYVMLKTFPYKIKGASYFANNIIKECKKYPFEKCDYVSLAANYGARGKIKKTDYLDRIKIKFCDEEFWCMRNYHEHLTNVYGDYMKLPPEVERVANHNYKLYWKE